MLCFDSSTDGNNITGVTSQTAKSSSNSIDG